MGSKPWHNARFTDDFDQQMVRLTVERHHGERISLPLGRNNGYRRAEGAVTLVAAAGPTLPFELEIDLNADGSWTLREVRTVSPSPSGYNQHWHFAWRDTPPAPTAAQTRTLARWLFRADERPYTAGSGPGAPLQRWVFAGLDTAALEALGNDGKRAYYA